MTFLEERLGCKCRKWLLLIGKRGRKKYPQRPYADGGNPKGGMNKAATMIIHGLTNANPMPRKKPPRTSPAPKASEGEEISVYGMPTSSIPYPLHNLAQGR